MGRHKGSRNKNALPLITYPRKCDDCSYVANNPAMYSYHKHTHDKIPIGKLCDHGCGQQAKFKNTAGKYTCNNRKCPEYVKQQSLRASAQWTTPDAVQRKIKTKQIFKECCYNNAAVREKQLHNQKIRFGNFTPEQMKDFRHFSRRVRNRAQRWAKKQGYILGQQTFHVDHKFCVRDAWLLNVSEGIINNPVNLQVIPAKENSSKGWKSSITLEQLLLLIEETES